MYLYTLPQEVCVFVTIERADRPVIIRLWKSQVSFRAIRRAVKAAYPGATLGFGRVFWRTL